MANKQKILKQSRPQEHSTEQYHKYTVQYLTPIMHGLNSKPNLFQITGSKGKSSTAYFLSQILPNSGLFTSPHIYSVRDRFAVNGKTPSESEFTDAIAPIIAVDHLSPFQKFFLASFNHFSKKKPDNLIVEVGIGGYQDDTSVLNKFNHKIKTKTLVISRIEKEHCNLLGDSLYEIAVQKTLLTDKKVAKIVVHPRNLLNSEIKDGIFDCLDDMGVSRNKIVTVAESENVFEECLSMALAAATVPNNKRKYEIIGHNIAKTKNTQVKMLPAHQNFYYDKQNNVAHFIDSAHTENSIKAALSQFSHQLEHNGRQDYPIIVLFSQTRVHRDFRHFVHLIKNIFPCAKFTVLTPPGTFDLRYSQDCVIGSELELNKQIHQYLQQQDPGTVFIQGATQLKTFMRTLRDCNVLTIGSQHSGCLVQACIDGYV